MDIDKHIETLFILIYCRGLEHANNNACLTREIILNIRNTRDKTLCNARYQLLYVSEFMFRCSLHNKNRSFIFNLWKTTEMSFTNSRPAVKFVGETFSILGCWAWRQRHATVAWRCSSGIDFVLTNLCLCKDDGPKYNMGTNRLLWLIFNYSCNRLSKQNLFK